MKRLHYENFKKSNYRVWDDTYIGQNPMSREHKELNSVRKIK